MLRDYAAYLKQHHLSDLALAHVRLCEPMPALRQAADLPAVKAWLARILAALEAADPESAPIAPGEPAAGWGASELAIAQSACREVLVSFIPRYTTDLAVAIAIVRQLEAKQRVTQRSAAEALREADRLKDEFLSIISHELRTPLNAIMGFGSILEDGLAGPLNERQQAYLAKMFDGTERLLDLINDVLDMSLIRAGRFVICKAPMHLADAMAGAIDSLMGQIAAHGHQLELALTPGMPPIEADADRVRQLIAYMIANAIKFTPKGGRIAVTARPERDALRVEVTDTGPGVPPEAAYFLFDRFTQLDMGPTRKAGGTGLGLPICRGIVEAHGGAIGVESPPEGGATFYFTLPLAVRTTSVP